MVEFLALQITGLMHQSRIIILEGFKEILNLSDEEYEEKCYMYNYYYSSSYYSPFIYSYYGSYHLDNLMTNQKEDKIIYEKELNIDYYFTSSTENDMNIKSNQRKKKARKNI